VLGAVHTAKGTPPQLLKNAVLSLQQQQHNIEFMIMNSIMMLLTPAALGKLWPPRFFVVDFVKTSERRRHPS
jgi:hypothetical protein